MSNTTYYFMPSMRQGLLPDKKSPAFKEGRPAIDVGLDITARKKDTGTESLIPDLPSMYLYGPGDILGFNPRIVVRTDPQPDTGTFEANYFPMIEFADADFVWRYSPVRNYDDDDETTPTLTDNEGNATPWITLIVLVMETWSDIEGVTKEFEEQTSPNRDLPPYITVNSIDHLPDLSQAKFWAHVQVTGPEGLTDNDITSRAEQAICRLMCPRRLAPKTKYAAFVVPTFELGRQAGLGEKIGDTQNFSWYKKDDEDKDNLSPINLPYYYRWEFITSDQGDFEYLVRLLEARDLSGLGKREIDCSNPGVDGLNEKITENLGLEGALQPVGMTPTEWGGDLNQNGVSPLNEFQTILAGKLNEGENKNDLPLVRPPLYGQWQYDKGQYSNDLQFRVGIGIFLNYDARVVIPINLLKGRLLDANGSPISNREINFNFAKDANPKKTDEKGYFSFQIVSHPQSASEILSLKTAESINFSFKVEPKKGLIVLTEQDVLNENWYSTLNLDPRHRVAAALGSQVVRKEQESLMASAWEQLGANEANQILTLAQSGQAVATRLFNKLIKLPEHTQYLLFNSLLKNEFLKPNSVINAIQTTPRTLLDEIKAKYPNAAALDPTYLRITRLGGPISRKLGLHQKNHKLDNVALTTEVKLEPPRPFGGALRAISDKLAGKTKAAGVEITTHIQRTNPIVGVFSPDKTIKGRILPRLADSSPVLTEKLTGLKPFAFSPEFPKPLYEELRSLGDQYILPGVEKIPQNTIGLLETNRRFIEAFLCGCNHEMSKEFLWREYPAALGGTYFRQFWDVSEKPVLNPSTVFFSFMQQKMMAKAKKIGVIYNASFVKNEQRQKLQKYMDVQTVKNLENSDIDALYTKVMVMEAHQEANYDIKKISDWTEELGKNAVSAEEAKLVLTIRGDLLRRYPGTVIYAVDAVIGPNGKPVPAMAEYLLFFKTTDLSCKSVKSDIINEFTKKGIKLTTTTLKVTPSGSGCKIEDGNNKYFLIDNNVYKKGDYEKIKPLEFQSFGANLPPDITFTGFNFSENDARSDEKKQKLGKFFILEERVGEARFGLDVTREQKDDGTIDCTTWDNLAWADFGLAEKEMYGKFLGEIKNSNLKGQWGDKDNPSSSAFRASKTLQKPFRLAIHADDLLGLSA